MSTYKQQMEQLFSMYGSPLPLPSPKKVPIKVEIYSSTFYPTVSIANFVNFFEQKKAGKLRGVICGTWGVWWSILIGWKTTCQSGSLINNNNNNNNNNGLLTAYPRGGSSSAKS